MTFTIFFILLWTVLAFLLVFLDAKRSLRTGRKHRPVEQDEYVTKFNGAFFYREKK